MQQSTQYWSVGHLLHLLCIAAIFCQLSAQPEASAGIPGPAPAAAAPPALKGTFPISAASIAGQGSVAGLGVMPDFTEQDYLTGLQERQRYPEASDFVLDFANQEGQVLEGPGGRSLQLNQANKPALLRAEGLAQTHFTLKPCGLNQPHLHPRGSMTTYVLTGTINTGFVEESSGRTLEVNVTAGQTIVYPRGLMHWVHNIECEEATYLDTFSSGDVGLSPVVETLFHMPPATIAAAMNIPLAQAEAMHAADYPTIGLGPMECLARCNATAAVASSSVTVPVASPPSTSITVG